MYINKLIKKSFVSAKNHSILTEIGKSLARVKSLYWDHARDLLRMVHTGNHIVSLFFLLIFFSFVVIAICDLYSAGVWWRQLDISCGPTTYDFNKFSSLFWIIAIGNWLLLRLFLYQVKNVFRSTDNSWNGQHFMPSYRINWPINKNKISHIENHHVIWFHCGQQKKLWLLFLRVIVLSTIIDRNENCTEKKNKIITNAHIFCGNLCVESPKRFLYMHTVGQQCSILYFKKSAYSRI